MQQHAEAKRAYPDAIVFFRLGDFYEMFGDDAVVGAKELDLTLTSRNKGRPDEIPMAGVPYHSAHNYISRLIERGHKVAICEQLADPTTVRGIVPRGVVRVITPGTLTLDEHLTPGCNNWLAAVEVSEAKVGLALFDLSTGELNATEVSDLSAVLAELSASEPREVIVGGDAKLCGEAMASIERLGFKNRLRSASSAWADSPEAVLGSALESSEALGEGAVKAAAQALRYVRACHPSRAEVFVRRVVPWDVKDRMILDARTQAHLELVRSPQSGEKATLLAFLDQTETAPGARLLRSMLLAPLIDLHRIRRRQDAVEFFVQNPRLRSELKACLRGFTDLERIGTRALLSEATPKDLGKLRDGLLAAKQAKALLDPVDDLVAKESLFPQGAIDTLEELRDELSRALVERPGASPKEGAIFLSGYDALLDQHADLVRRGTEHMLELEKRLRESTDITTLKLRFTRVFGWYIEVSRAQLSRVPKAWRRKQTVAGGERFTSDELDELALRISGAEEEFRERELWLLGRLFEKAAKEAPRIYQLSTVVARWDVALGLAEVAHTHDYVRPRVDDSDVLEIRDGRHPVVERLAELGRFVPNDVVLSAGGERLWLITGPNMAGKSTFLRQVALITILAQMGSFVPAKSARIGLVDRVLSRVGASDNLAQGQSTFMVEMTETAEILAKASRRSLVILDEIGRGTSTFDGLAIARAVAEYLDSVAACRALFATHYHELVTLAEESKHVANYSVTAQDQGDNIVFLHRVLPGAASRSYGILVAKLAGLPASVLARANAILAFLESGGAEARAGVAERAQLSLFSSQKLSKQESEVLATLRALDVENLRPIEALGLLARLKDRL